MLLKTRGIVLRTQKFSETSLIVKILTEERGLKTYIISGIRKSKSKVSYGLFQLMNVLDLVVYDRENKNIQRIKEVRASSIYEEIPFNVFKSSIGLFIIEVVQKTIKEEEFHPALFSYLLKVLKYIDTSKNPIGNIHLHFLLEFSSFLGFAPGGVAMNENKYFNLQEGTFTLLEHDKHSLNEQDSKIISDFMHLSLKECHNIGLNNNIRNRLLTNLLQFYTLHVDNFGNINSHKVLQEVFN